MFCPKCGKAIKDDSKFCKYCGATISKNNQKSNAEYNSRFHIPKDNDKNDNKNMKIFAVVVVIALIILVALLGIVLSDNSEDTDDEMAVESNNKSNTTQSVSLTSSNEQAQITKSWVSIGSFSGSGSGSQSISIPEGQIRIDITAHPIKNYVTNYLHVSGSHGQASLDWGPNSEVTSKSDSISFTSSSPSTFTIDYLETSSWNVEVYKYQ